MYTGCTCYLWISRHCFHTGHRSSMERCSSMDLQWVLSKLFFIVKLHDNPLLNFPSCIWTNAGDLLTNLTLLLQTSKCYVALRRPISRPVSSTINHLKSSSVIKWMHVDEVACNLVQKVKKGCIFESHTTCILNYSYTCGQSHDNYSLFVCWYLSFDNKSIPHLSPCNVFIFLIWMSVWDSINNIKFIHWGDIYSHHFKRQFTLWNAHWKWDISSVRNLIKI